MAYETDFVTVAIDSAMLKRAAELEEYRRVNRTRASEVDSWIGILGEIAWSQVRYGTIDAVDLVGNKGRVDDDALGSTVEVKASKTWAWTKAHLMVREDYALKRAADYYVFILFRNNEPDRQEKVAFVCGWATHDEVLASTLRERFSTKTGQRQGYKCYEVPCGELHPIRQLPFGLIGVT